MRKQSFILLLAASAALSLPSYAGDQPADQSSTSQPVSVGQEGLNEGRGDPSGVSTGQALGVGQEGLSEGRGDPSGVSTGASVGAGGETVNEPGRQ